MELQKDPGEVLRPFTGTKTVLAMPMCAAHAQKEGANVPPKYFEVGNASYNPGADGYIVQYPDGYRSWSPKAVFEETYKPSATVVDRMNIELTDLRNRIIKASAALYTPGLLSQYQSDLLKVQLKAMAVYAESLLNRINDYSKPRTTTSVQEDCK